MPRLWSISLSSKKDKRYYILILDWFLLNSVVLNDKLVETANETDCWLSRIFASKIAWKTFSAWLTVWSLSQYKDNSRETLFHCECFIKLVCISFLSWDCSWIDCYALKYSFVLESNLLEWIERSRNDLYGFYFIHNSEGNFKSI